MYLSEWFSRSGQIEVEGEKGWVVETILDDRKKNHSHQFLVHSKGHPKHEAS
jgi:hypothetical protein